MEKANWTFEEQWQQAFEKAEVAPPPHVWVAIDGQLANEQAAGYKKEADFYKWLAAACLLLFALGGAFYWFSGNNITDAQRIADKTTATESISSAPDQNDAGQMTTVAVDDKAENSGEMVTATVDEEEESNEHAPISLPVLPKEKLVAERSNPVTGREAATAGYEEHTPDLLKEETIDFAGLEPIETQISSVVEPWESEQLYGVAKTWMTIEEDKVASPLWAGVSFSTGAFDPGFGGDNNSDLVFASNDGFLAESAVPLRSVAQPTGSFSSGQSVSGGVNVGTRIAKRMTLSSGIQYNAFTTGSVTSQLASDTENNTFALTNETSDIELNDALDAGALTYDGQQVQLANEYQYLTIPIKAGYVLLDKKFNITLNTGFSSNFRVDSRLVASGESTELSNDFSTSDGYQRVYFNFLTSVELGYLFKGHYQFLLEPNYNQALTDFTSSSNPNRAKPRNIGVSVGFRYNF